MMSPLGLPCAHEQDMIDLRLANVDYRFILRLEPIGVSGVLSEGAGVMSNSPSGSGTYSGAGEDADLVARAVAGEVGAFDVLFRKHYARVYNFALRLDGNTANAEDIAQTAFVRAYSSLGRIRDGHAFLKLLYRTVVNLERDRAKSARRKPWVSFHDLLRAIRDDAGGGEEPAMFADASLNPEHVIARDDRSLRRRRHSRSAYSRSDRERQASPRRRRRSSRNRGSLRELKRRGDAQTSSPPLLSRL